MQPLLVKARLGVSLPSRVRQTARSFWIRLAKQMKESLQSVVKLKAA